MADMPRRSDSIDFQYDVCLSFAGEQRPFVERVATALRNNGVRVFFDEYETAQLWGRDLYAHLDEVYGHLGRYCILFASAAYAAKVWTNHERRSAQARALKANQEYILPARFDDTPIPGLPDTIHYIDLRKVTPRKLAALAAAKIGGGHRREYLPPVPDKLFRRLHIQNNREAQSHAHSQASGFLDALRRMSAEERLVVLKTIWFGCTVDLPENVHINIDLLRRITSKPPARLKRILGGVQSLGFTCRVRDDPGDHDHGEQELGRSEMLHLEWIDLHDEDGEYPALMVAREMVIGATDNYCEEHGWPFLERLDFSQLATVTATKESHGRATPFKKAPQPASRTVRKTRARKRLRTAGG